MKVAIATDIYWPRTSDIAVSIDAFKRELEAFGDEVHVLAPDCGENGDAARSNIHRFKSFAFPFSGKAVYKLLDALQPDVVHVQTGRTIGWATWSWAHERGVPVVVSCHTDWERSIHLTRWLVQNALRSYCEQGEVVIAPTERIASVVAGCGATQPVVIIPTGLEKLQSADRSTLAALLRDIYVSLVWGEIRTAA